MRSTTNADEAQVSGILIQKMKEYVLINHGNDFFDAMTQNMSPDSKHYLTGKILAVSRARAQVFAEFYTAWREQRQDTHGKEFMKLIQWVAAQNLTTIMSLYLKVGTPDFIAKRFFIIWKQLLNFGTLKLISGKSKKYIFDASGTEVYGEGVCKAATAWGTAALELSGGKKVRVIHLECIHQADKRCRFLAEWN